MNTIAEIELVRARWRRALAHERLDTTTRDDFALSGLAARLRAPSARLMLLLVPSGIAVALFTPGCGPTSVAFRSDSGDAP